MELLLKHKPYKVTGTIDSLKVSISPVSKLKPGDLVYQVLLDNGVVMLYPEKEFKKTKFYKELER